jgi:hypothetical protein
MTETTPAAPGKPPTKSDRLVIRLTPDQRGRLRARAEELGLDEASLARMLIVTGLAGAAMPNQASSHAADAWPDIGARPYSLTDAKSYVDDEPPPVEEMDIPADPDGDPAPAGPEPSLLDEIAALTATPRPEPRQNAYPLPAYVRSRPAHRAQRFNNRDWGPAAWSGPGSMTRAVGVGGELMGNMQGDGRGNVTRDNFAHFGAVGTRSR